MSADETNRSKVEQPHVHFDAPHEIVADPALSIPEKLQVLASLEQDARQLEIAAGEGMSGDEDTNLHALQEVMHAKKALVLPPITVAYEVVMSDLRNRQTKAESDEKQMLIGQAVEALEAVKNAGLL